MAIEKVIDLQIKSNADQAEKSVGNLKTQLRQAQLEVATLSDKFGATSNEAINAAKRAGELKDKIGDAKALTEAFNPDAKFKSLSSSLAGVAGGFAAVQGGMALFGNESEDVQKTLLKVQSAMALSQGLQSIGESVDSFKQLGAVVKSSYTSLLAFITGKQAQAVVETEVAVAAGAATVAIGAETAVVEGATVAQWSWNAALLANPVVAIIAGIVALIAAGYGLMKMLDSSSETNAKNSASIKANSTELWKQKDIAEKGAIEIQKHGQNQIEMAKASGASADAIRKLEIKLIDEQIAFANSSREVAKNTYHKNLNLLATLKASDADEEQIKNQTTLTQKSLEEFGAQTKNLNTSLIAKKDLIAKQQIEVVQGNTDHQKKVEENEKKHQDKIDEIVKKKKEDYKKSVEDGLKDLADAGKKTAEADAKIQDDAKKIIDDLAKSQETPAQKLNREFEEKKSILESAGKSTFELEMQHNSDLENLDAITKQKNLDNEKAHSDAKIKLSEAEAAAKQALFQKTSETLNKGADLLGKNTAAGKSMAVAAALINTYQGITTELATKTVTPFEIGLKIANVAIIAATGFKAVKDIIAVPVPGGAGGVSAPSGGGAMGGSSSPPQFNVVGASGTNQIAQAIGGQQQQPIQAYVVAGAVTTGQALNRSIITNASMG